MSIEIEAATVADGAACAGILREAREHSLPYLPVLHTEQEDVQFLTDRVFGTDTVLVAVDAETRRIVGFIAFAEGWVDHLYVMPEVHRRGIGARLLDRAKLNQATLKLWTFQRNVGAIRFYERHGFSVLRYTDGAGNEEKEPDVLLEWRTKPTL
ncbi:MAG TPA: GNAT family N-acetyltransferase [Blastocatellia bacterium]|nr:GNAT family N-acetyltransferase [Blastocatellia bacterium]